MEKKEIAMIPFVAHESSMNRMERANKRLWILNIILVVVELLTVAGIITYFLLPSEIIETETTNTQEVSDIQDSQVNQSIGE